MNKSLLNRLITIRHGKFYVGENKATKKQARELRHKPFYMMKKYGYISLIRYSKEHTYVEI